MNDANKYGKKSISNSILEVRIYFIFSLTRKPISLDPTCYQLLCRNSSKENNKLSNLYWIVHEKKQKQVSLNQIDNVLKKHEILLIFS